MFSLCCVRLKCLNAVLSEDFGSPALPHPQLLPWTATSPVQRYCNCYKLSYLLNPIVLNWKLKITKCNKILKLIFKLRKCLINFKWILDSSLPRLLWWEYCTKGEQIKYASMCLWPDFIICNCFWVTWVSKKLLYTFHIHRDRPAYGSI